MFDARQKGASDKAVYAVLLLAQHVHETIRWAKPTAADPRPGMSQSICGTNMSPKDASQKWCSAWTWRCGID